MVPYVNKELHVLLGVHAAHIRYFEGSVRAEVFRKERRRNHSEFIHIQAYKGRGVENMCVKEFRETFGRANKIGALLCLLTINRYGGGKLTSSSRIKNRFKKSVTILH